MPNTEAALGVEEIWNQKQLVKAVGTLVAATASSGVARTLVSVESSLRIGDGLRAKSLRGGLRAWLEQFHSADFCIVDGPDGVTTISLTESGAAKYQVSGHSRAPRMRRHLL